jgi:hypothetical protein
MSLQRTVRTRTLDLYRGINEFKRGYQSRSNLVLEDSQNILNKWENYFSQLLNVHRVSEVRQIKICTADPLVYEPSPFEFDTNTAKLKRCKLPGSD